MMMFMISLLVVIIVGLSRAMGAEGLRGTFAESLWAFLQSLITFGGPSWLIFGLVQGDFGLQEILSR